MPQIPVVIVHRKLFKNQCLMTQFVFLGTVVISAICQIVSVFLWEHPCPLEARYGCVMCFGQ